MPTPGTAALLSTPFGRGDHKHVLRELSWDPGPEVMTLVLKGSVVDRTVC